MELIYIYYGLIYFDRRTIVKGITYVTQLHKIYRFYITQPNYLVILLKMPQTKHFINSTYLSNNLLLNVWHVT